VDGGIGCAQMCGLPVILEGEGPADAREPLVGEDLRRVVLVKHARGGPLDRVPIEVACDVTNPLFGPEGAARVYGPQKGASPAQVAELDALLERLAVRTETLDVARRAGAGAAGGLGFAMMAFFGATMRGGFDLVAQTVKLRERLVGADLCITGEGRLDASSLHGKTTVSVAKLCREAGVRCCVIAGSISEPETLAGEFDAMRALATGTITVEQSIQDAERLIRRAASDLVRAAG
jgi:glycerate kinase